MIPNSLSSACNIAKNVKKKYLGLNASIKPAVEKKNLACTGKGAFMPRYWHPLPNYTCTKQFIFTCTRSGVNIATYLTIAFQR